MSDSSISVRHKQFIEEIAEKEGFKRYKLNFNQGAFKGDNYMGLITLVKIEETPTKVSNLILKSAQKGEELRKKTVVKEAYERENYIYNTIFPLFSELEKKYKVRNRFDGIAGYYGGLNEFNEECLVLNNMKEIGYKLWDRKKPMDSHHVGAVMTRYGKFHALSYALRKLNPEKFSEVSKNLSSIFDGKFSADEMQNSMVNMMDKAMKAVGSNMEAATALKRFFQSLGGFFKHTIPIRDKYTVILHGDCWCNNMLFKYEDANKPSNVCLLDWQLSSMGNPVLDVAYFFYACSSKFCMDDYKKFMKIYHNSLSETLKEFGINVDEIMSFDELQTQWRIYAKYGLYMALLVIRIMLSEQEEAADINDVTKKNMSIMEIFNVEIANVDEYNKRVNNVISHMIKNRLI